MIDDYANHIEVAFQNKQDSLRRLKKFYQLLTQNDNFNYMEISFQPLYVKDFRGEDTFLYSYKYNQHKPPMLFDNGSYSYVYSTQLNR